MNPGDTHAAAARLVARLEELGSISETEGALTRRFATPALRRAGDTVGAWMEAAGMAVGRDAVGNLVGRYEGLDRGARALVIGSHLDTVPNAGRFDGALGVLAGVAAVERLATVGERLPFAIEVVGFADEEGVRFGTAYLGSSVFVGSFDPALLQRRDADGVSMADAMRSGGDDPAAIPACARRAEELIGFLEVHIEQGPLLEVADLPVGVVGAIAGQTRARVVLAGEAGHAGTVPMEHRRDALAGAAEVVLAVETIGRTTPGLVATVGDVVVVPGAGNVIAGRVTIAVDVRHPDDGPRLEAVGRVRQAVELIARQRDLQFEWDVLLETAAVVTDERLTAALAVSIEAAGHSVERLVSGAGHDAALLASVTPVALLFVRCRGGVSHAPAESASEADIAVALDVLDRALRRLAATPLARSPRPQRAGGR